MTDQTAAVALPGSPAGLSSAEARVRLRDEGGNAVPISVAQTRLRILAAQFANPLVVILAAASVIALAVGEQVESGVILLMIGISAALGFVQEARSSSAIAALQLRVAPRAAVRRDGMDTSIARADVVREDVLLLAAGSVIAADARLVEANHLFIDESPMTGESAAVLKAPGPGQEGLVRAGTSVVSGSGVAIVTSVGRASEYGAIAAHLAARAPETDFQRGIRQFGLLVARLVLVLSIAVMVVNVLLGRPVIDSLLFAVALAVGLTPELLPAIATLNLTNGARRLERQGVLVKRLPAIQNLGATTVICTDKTGTLTVGRLTLLKNVDAWGRDSPSVLDLARMNSRLQAGYPNPLDTALLADAPPTARDAVKLGELPFDFERRCLSVVLREGARTRLIAKGSPEAILARCTNVNDGSAIAPLEPARRAAIEALVRSNADQGIRAVAVASRPVEVPATPDGVAPGAIPGPGMGQASWCTPDLEHDLVFEGLLFFADAPKPGVAATLRALMDRGVALKIVTGDDERVASHIARQLAFSGGALITGDDLDRLGDDALVARAPGTTIFARVNPEQKLRIVAALRAGGAVVAYIGDGINDAPPLHEADVGISVENATDVARAAADVILLEPSLAAVETGIVEGRRTFANTLKYIRMGTSSNFGNMLSMASASLLLPFLPMLPTQILLNNLIYDLSQTTIPSDHVDPEAGDRPARWDLPAIRRFMFVLGPVSSIFDLATFGVLLVVFRVSEAAFQTGWFIESLCTQVLVIFAIRTRRRPFWRSRPSRLLVASATLAVLAAVVIPLSPLAGVLGFAGLPPLFWPFLGLTLITYLGLVELVKGLVDQREKMTPVVSSP